MHNGTLLGEATLDVQSKTFTVSFNWAISEDRQQDIKNLLADFFCKEVQVIEGNEVDRISMVTPHSIVFGCNQ